jgi:hypothetical protein
MLSLSKTEDVEAKYDVALKCERWFLSQSILYLFPLFSLRSVPVGSVCVQGCGYQAEWSGDLCVCIQSFSFSVHTPQYNG